MSEPYEGWAILELFGHRRLAGRVSQVEQYGGAMLRLDVPAEDGEVAASQFYGAAAIYCLTPTTEEIARAVARRNRPEPVQRWELPAPLTADRICPGCGNDINTGSGAVCADCEADDAAEDDDR